MHDLYMIQFALKLKYTTLLYYVGLVMTIVTYREEILIICYQKNANQCWHCVCLLVVLRLEVHAFKMKRSFYYERKWCSPLRF